MRFPCRQVTVYLTFTTKNGNDQKKKEKKKKKKTRKIVHDIKTSQRQGNLIDPLTHNTRTSTKEALDGWKDGWTP